MSTKIEPSLQDKSSNTTTRGMARAQAILSAAYELFVTQGYAAFSMRSVAAKVGVSLSNVQHYYPSKDSLIEEMLLFAYSEHDRRAETALASTPDASKLERFISAMDIFIAGMKAPEIVGGLGQTWVMAQQHPSAAKLVAKIQARERKTIFQLMRGINSEITDDEYQVRAAVAVALIEGMSIQYANRGRRPFTVEELDAQVRQTFLRLATQP